MKSRNYSPEEALEVIKLRMNYNSAKTLNENLLVLSEQPSYVMRPEIRPMPSDYTGRGGEFERQRYSNTDKETYYKLRNTLPVIDGTSVSDLIINVREYFFSTAGITTQVVLSILGSEIGAPIVFGTIDGVIILNDLIAMKKEWRNSDLTSWTEEWFLFHLQDGPGYTSEHGNGFLRFMEDLLLILTGGIIKLIGKGAKGIYKTVMSKFKNIGPALEKISSKISSVSSIINKLPKSVAQYYEKFKGQAESAINLLKTPKAAVQSVKKNVPRAGVTGALTYGFMYFFEKTISPMLFGKNNEVTELNPDVSDNRDLIEIIGRHNPKLFPQGIKKFEIVTNSKKEFEKFIINGQSYKLIDDKQFIVGKI